jgi:hypothetical protein
MHERLQSTTIALIRVATGFGEHSSIAQQSVTQKPPRTMQQENAAHTCVGRKVA